jgi:uridine phosphorylase
VICTEAVRDEGVSHHYVPPARSAEPSSGLTRALEASLQVAGIAFRAVEAVAALLH